MTPVRGPGPGGDRAPIAITGIGCRLPGASSPEELWNLLMDGRTTAEGLELRTTDGRRTRLTGSFLKDVDSFDAGFFGISPREAAAMDPQQRLLLETAWEALEDANEVPKALAGQPVGVYIGISGYDHGRLHYGSANADLHTGTGSALSIAANRLSYTFDFSGPSISVDTACSSSLVAVHLACRSLWDGEAELALAGGVNVILDEAVSSVFSRAGFLSPDGRSKAFDASADGYGRGEGCAVIVLKPLDRALEDGDPVYALIRGTAVNQDGRSNGLTAPNGIAQEQLVAAACRHAGVAAGEVGYIEAHGTGTALGDPVEARALGRALGAGRPEGRPCLVGSVKGNLGHLEAAAGIAGLVKAALCVQRRELPPNAGYQEPNPDIDFDALGLSVVDAPTDWPADYREAIAGVSSFGFGGTNAHIVLSEPSRTRSDRCPTEEGRTLLLPVSGQDAGDAGRQAEAYGQVLHAAPRDFAALTHTAGAFRTHHRYRRALVADSAQHARALLEETAGDPPREPSAPRRLGRVAFVFSGQGNQWPGMGGQLLRDEPVGAQVLGECDDILGKLTGWSLLDGLAAGTSLRLEDPAVLQPVLVSLQMAIAKVVESWGVHPDACFGHSLGEISAAAATGALGLEEALFLAVTRGELMREATDTGRTALLGLPADDVHDRIERAGGEADIAAWNSPRSTLIAGDAGTVRQIVEEAAAEGVFSRVLPGTTAFHSRRVEAFGHRLAQLVDGLVPQEATPVFVSTVTGRPLDGRALDASYWGRNLREPVRFSQAVNGLTEDGYRTFIEIGAHPVLTPAVIESAASTGTDVLALPTARRGEAERGALLHTLGALYEAGAEVDFTAVNPGDVGTVKLPVRQWRGARFGDRGTRAVTTATTSGGLLGRRFSVASGAAHYWEGTLSQDAPATEAGASNRYLLHGVPLHLPDAVVTSVLEAADEALASAGPFTVGVRPATGTDRLARDRATQLALVPDGQGARAELHTRSKDAPAWSLAATATVDPLPRRGPKRADLGRLRRRCADGASGDETRTALRAAGLELPAPQRIVSVHHGAVEALVRLQLSVADRRSLTEAAVLAAVVVANRSDSPSGVVLPAGLDGVVAQESGAVGSGIELWAHVTDGASADLSGGPAVCVAVHAADGTVLAGIERVLLTPLDEAEAAALRHHDEAFLGAGGVTAAELLAEDPDERARLLTEYLVKETARVLRAPIASVSAEVPMNALGLDSIMGFELHRRLRSSLGIEVPVVRFLRGMSTREIAAELAELLSDGAQHPAHEPAPVTELADPKDIEKVLAELDDLDEAEVDSLLLRLSAPAVEES
ncbi:type I polyketide synthase [Streptomyces syringium]|uniref:type I polyketide synthase n=1 Tax=Streptomyces syringium TaxID=76729 RepID=UPI003D91A154